MKSIITTFTSLLLVALISTSMHGQTAVCQVFPFSLSAGGAINIDPNLLDGGSFDYDSLSVSPSYFTCDDLGIVEVTLSAHKGNNVSTCSVEIPIQDTYHPLVVCQPDGSVVVPIIGGQATVTAEMVEQISLDNCEIISKTLDQTVFDASVNTATVELTVTDQGNNSVSCSSVIQIGGVHQAYLNCKASIEFAISPLPNETRIVELADVLDYGPFPSWNLELVLKDSNDVIVPGNELVGLNTGQTYTATVSDPVTGATCTTNITITEPYINCVTGLNHELLPWASTLQLYVSDVDDGSSTFDTMWLSQSSFDCYDLGLTEITLYGQIGSTVYNCITTLTLIDNAPPVAICDVDVFLALDANGQATLTAGLVDDGSYDNCGIDTMTLDKTHFDTSSNSIELVQLDVYDGSGNVNSCWVNVHILGAGNPNLVCINNLNIGLPLSGSYVPDVKLLIANGPFYGWDLSYEMFDMNNELIPNNEITTDHLNQTIVFIVEENNSGETCNGSIFVDGSIPNDCSTFFICDSRPWDTPLGNCTSGHTTEDFVEWPANIELTSCYYSPSYLENYTTVDYRNARPQIVGNCLFKAVVHEDEVFIFPTDKIKVLRTWTIIDWITLNIYNYTQVLKVDLADCATPVIVRNAFGQGIQGVNIYKNVLTNLDGQAQINSNRYNSLSAKLEGTLRDGIDLHDELAIQEYINNQRTLSPLQEQLADVNKDTEIDIRDALEIKKIALEIYDPQTSEPWLFYGAKADLTEGLNRPVDAGDYYGGPVDIIGAKRGDINGDATNFGQLEQRNNIVDIDLFIKDELLFDEVSYTVDFSINDLDNIGGQQLELVVDLNKVDIRKVTSPAFPDFSDSDYKITEDNILIIYWRASNDIILDGGTSSSKDIPILSIDLVAKQNSILSTVISLNQSQRNTIARVNDDDRYAFVIEWVDKIISNTSEHEDKLNKVTIAPNPGNNMVQISVDNLSHKGMILEVYNAVGQKMKSLSINSNSAQLLTQNWNNGIYLYKLSNESSLNKTGMFMIQHE